MTMFDFKYLMPLDTMERITRQHLCDNFDAVLERVDKENIGFVILNEEGKDGQVLCPARWMEYCFDDDFGCIINSALRYAIRRHTYMPGVVVDFIRKYINILDTPRPLRSLSRISPRNSIWAMWMIRSCGKSLKASW